ncbi:MAG: tetratricopeptide repeat protein [Myxococcaceae bacterium]
MACPDTNQLSAFVAGALRDEALRLVESHADGCTACRTVIAEAALTASTASTPGTNGAAVLRRGDLAGRYLILERAGSGAMGDVFAAWDPKLARRVALKVLKVGSKARMLDEARAMARVAHPNIVPVFDVSEADSRSFVAMEFVEGSTLRDWLSAPGERAAREVISIFERAGAGLAAAHDAGVVHRDFKPENVLLGRDGSVRVTDFGLAKLEAEDASGGFAGTPAYMAPEQQRGLPADARSDQYSFCVSLFETLGQERPSVSEPISPEQWSQLRASRRVRKVLKRGLSNDPANRFESMHSLLVALSAPRRKQWLIAAGALGAALVLVSGWSFQRFASYRACALPADQILDVWSPQQKAAAQRAFAATKRPFAASAWTAASRVLDSYASKWKQKRVDACAATHLRAEQSAELLDRRLACLQTKLVAFSAVTSLLGEADAKMVENWPRVTGAVGSIQDCDADALLASVAPPRELKALVQESRAALVSAHALAIAGRYSAARPAAEAVLERARGIPYLPHQAEALALTAIVLGEQGENAPARLRLEEALLAAQAGGDAAQEARIWARQAGEAHSQGKYEEGLSLAKRARAVLTRVNPPPPLLDAHIHNVTGVLLKTAGKYSEAFVELREGLALLAPLESAAPERARAHSNLGNALLAAGQLDEARPEFESALRVAEDFLGAEHPDVAGHHTNLATWLYRMGKLDEARAETKTALRTYEAAFGENHPSISAALSNLGLFEKTAGRPAEALVYQRRALAIRQKLLGANHPEVVTLLANIGSTFSALNRHSEAQNHLCEALMLAEEKLGKKHPTTAAVLETRARDFARQQRWMDALRDLERARAIREARKQSSAHAVVLAGMGEAYAGLRQLLQARALLERSVELAQQGAAPDELAECRFQLARVLSAQGEGVRAHALAEKAFEGFAGAPIQRKLVETWLKRESKPLL